MTLADAYDIDLASAFDQTMDSLAEVLHRQRDKNSSRE